MFDSLTFCFKASILTCTNCPLKINRAIKQSHFIKEKPTILKLLHLAASQLNFTTMLFNAATIGPKKTHLSYET